MVMKTKKYCIMGVMSKQLVKFLNLALIEVIVEKTVK